MYHYAGNNPVSYSYPDGKFAETAWDVFSLAAGIASLVADVKSGNVKGAVIDSLGIIVDTAAVAIPCIPGGAGAAIKAARVTGAVANVAGGALSVQDGIENGNYLEAGLGALQTVGGVGQTVNSLKALNNYKNASKYFEGTTYSDKVQYQMSKCPGEMHSFPDDVKSFSGDGKIENIIGGDGKKYQKLTIPGTYNGKQGNFEFIKDQNGIINHRFFNISEE